LASSDVAPLLSGLWAKPGPTASSSTDEERCGSRIDSNSNIYIIIVFGFSRLMTWRD
jgi:hypothetical protein